MSWRWRLGEFFGIVVYMHVTFLLLLAWVALSHLLAGHGPAAALGGILFILMLFACVMMHEYGHAQAARRYGIRTRDITLLPIGGVARLEQMPRDPVQEPWVALAGPAVNVGLAAALFVLTWLFGGTAAPTDVHLVGGNLLQKLLWVNISLAVFNLLPAFPMDGGRVLRALLARRMEYARATRAAARVGQVMAFLFGFGGLASGQPFLIFIALFVYLGAEAEAQAVEAEATFRGVTVGQAMVTQFASLAPEDPLSRAVELLLSGTQQDFPMVTEGRLAGLLTRRDLLKGLRQQGLASPVANAMQRDVVPAEASAPLEEALQRMQMGELPAVPVLDAGGLAGLITMENIAELLAISAALGGASVYPTEETEFPAAQAGRPDAPRTRKWFPRRGEQH
jgi:Zn-dependent protease/predicted transcriptional regulator